MSRRKENRSWTSWLTTTLVLSCLTAWSGDRLQAKGPRDEDGRTVRGTVERLTTAPKGEVDGAVLDDGTVLHWPPHLEDRFAEVVKPGVRIRAEGEMHTGPKGDTRFEVRKLTNTETDATVENDEPGPGPKRRKSPPERPRRDERGERTETTQGKVERLTTAPKGEVDGAVLDDGTVLHWPPHLEDRFTAVVKQGDRVKATGFHEATPKGDRHFEVASLTNLDTDRTAENDDRGRAGPRPPRDRESGPRDGDRDREIREIKQELERLLRRVERLEQEQ